MKNVKANVLKLRNILAPQIRMICAIALVALVGFSMIACNSDVSGGGPGGGGDGGGDVDPPYKGSGGGDFNGGGGGGGDKQDAYLLDVSQYWNWQYWAIGKDGSSMVYNLDESTGVPTLLYLKPKKDSDKGITILFKANGLPDKVIAEGTVLYFGNYKGYTYDCAVIKPDGTIEYHFGNQTDTNFDTYLNSSRSVARSIDDVTWRDGLKLASLGVTFGSCVASVFFPPLAIGCVASIGSMIVDRVIDEDTSFKTERGKDVAHTINSVVSCGIDFVTLDGWLDAVGTADDCLSIVENGYTAATGNDLWNAFDNNQIKEPIWEAVETIDKVKRGNPPSAPSGVKATAESSSRITVSWDKVSDATGYFIYWSSKRDSDYTLVGGGPGPNVTSFTDSGLRPNTTYYYKVAAFNTWGKSTETGPVSAATFKDLDVPTGVSATAASTSITVRWSAVDGAAGYEIYRAENYPTASYSQVATSSTTSYTDTGLKANITYYYKVAAYDNNNGKSKQSDFASATTGTPVLAPPTGLTATASSSSITVSWNAVSGAEGYIIYRSTSASGPYNQVGGPTTSTSYTDNNVQPGTIYYYKVAAVDSEGNLGDQSSWVSKSVTPSYSLDGTWEKGSGTQITVSGSTGIFSVLEDTPLMQDAISQGYYSVGGTAWRKLTSTGANTWSGESYEILTTSIAPDVAAVAQWFGLTITMSADGQTITEVVTWSYQGASGTINVTWTRR